jgi:Zn-dependent protease with chaperone function
MSDFRGNTAPSLVGSSLRGACMTPMTAAHVPQHRFLLIKAVIWSEIVIVACMIVLGTIFYFIPVPGSGPLGGIIEPIASVFAAILIYGFTVLFVFGRLIVVARARRRPKQPLSEDLRKRLYSVGMQVQARMAFTQTVRFYIRRGSANAYVLRGNRIVLGERVVQKSTDYELAGIIGHELGHASKHHIAFKAIRLAATFTLVIATVALSAYAALSLIIPATVVAYIVAAEVPFNWKLEYAADATASKFLGSETVVQALSMLRTYNFDGVSLTHPPLSWRVNRLRTRFAEEPAMASGKTFEITPLTAETTDVLTSAEDHRLLEAAAEVCRKFNGSELAPSSVRWISGLRSDWTLLDSGYLLLPQSMAGKLQPEDWKPLIAASIAWTHKFRGGSKTRAKDAITVSVLLLIGIFGFTLVGGIIVAVLATLAPGQEDFSFIVAVFFLLSWPLTIALVRLFTANRSRSKLLRADHYAVGVVGREALRQALHKVDDLRIPDLEKRKRGMSAWYSKYPSIPSRLENIAKHPEDIYDWFTLPPAK